MTAPPLFRPGLALPVLWEDRHFSVIDKPAGLAVHPGPRGCDNVEARLMPQKRGGPWLAHRLDADTAGCLLIARRKTALMAAQKAFAEGRATKRYWALVAGRPAGQNGTFTSLLHHVSTPQAGWKMVSSSPPLRPTEEAAMMTHQDLHPAQHRPATCRGGQGRTGPGGTSPRRKGTVPSRHPDTGKTGAGKPARTSWRVLASNGTTSLLELTLHTGRTHQARVHCAALGTPILGDPLYGAGSALSPTLHGATTGPAGLCLLARSLELSLVMEGPAAPDGGTGARKGNRTQDRASPRRVSIRATADAPYMDAFLKEHGHDTTQADPQSMK